MHASCCALLARQLNFQLSSRIYVLYLQHLPFCVCGERAYVHVLACFEDDGALWDSGVRLREKRGRLGFEMMGGRDVERERWIGEVYAESILRDGCFDALALKCEFVLMLMR